MGTIAKIGILVTLLAGCAGEGEDPAPMDDAMTMPPADAGKPTMDAAPTCQLPGNLATAPTCAAGTTSRVPHPCPGATGVMCVDCFADPTLEHVEGCYLLAATIHVATVDYQGPFYCAPKTCLPAEPAP